MTSRFLFALSIPGSLSQSSYDYPIIKFKMIIASVTALTTLLADALVETKGWEDVGMKALLIGAVVYLVRAQTQDRKEHKEEMQRAWEVQNRESLDREVKTTAAMDANTEALSALTAITKEQTDYFKTVTRTIVDDRLRTKLQIP